jgi:hypothetical protein
MTAILHARVQESLRALGLDGAAEKLDPLLTNAIRRRSTYLDFLDELCTEAMRMRQEKRTEKNLKWARLPMVKTLDDFDFKFQPSIDQRLIRELATGRFVAECQNVLLFGPPGVGKRISPSRSEEPSSRLGIACFSRRHRTSSAPSHRPRPTDGSQSAYASSAASDCSSSTSSDTCRSTEPVRTCSSTWSLATTSGAVC